MGTSSNPFQMPVETQARGCGPSSPIQGWSAASDLAFLKPQCFLKLAALRDAPCPIPNPGASDKREALAFGPTAGAGAAA